jgi:hypothetical protein
MRERSGLLAAFLGIGAVLYHAASTTQATKPGTQQATVSNAAAVQPAPNDWDLLRNFDDFYQLGATPPENAASNGNIEIEHGNKLALHATFAANARTSAPPDTWWRSRLKNRFDWIIATVPDPELSGIKLNFDREISSIQNAVESAGYHFDRYFFPWRLRDPVADSQPQPAQELQSRRNLPGMLLFRASADIANGQKHKDLVVFLVGETPTSGVVSGQFKTALRFGEFSTVQVPIKIAGPGFSGSFASLARIIDKRQYQFFTWTYDWPSEYEFWLPRKQNVTLSRVTDSSIDVVKGFCSYVRKTWKDAAPIVLLVEENTAFGSGLTSLAKEVDRVYVVKFPRGISKLRNATESKEQIPGFGPSKAETARRELPFTLKEDQLGSSELPSYSREQSPVSQESVLLAISSLIKKGSLHYAGIVATNPLDLLFLSRFLRSASPNTRLFILDSDLLFEHGTDGSDFEGVLAITNYPLFAFNQIWTRSIEGNTIRIFPSATSESVYNAVVGLLSPRAGDTHLVEYGDPFQDNFDSLPKDKPALWIAVASRNGYAPVANLAPFRSSNPSSFFTALPTNGELRVGMHDKMPRWAPEYWESWGYCFGCLCAVCLIYATLILLARPAGNRLFSIFSVKPDEPKCVQRAHFLFLLGLCLSVLIALWLAVPYIVLQQNAGFLHTIDQGAWPAAALAVLFSGISLIACLCLFIRRRASQSPGSAHWIGLAFTAAVAAFLLPCVAGSHPAVSSQLLRALRYGTIMIAAAVVPISVTEIGRSRERISSQITSKLWAPLLLFVGLVTVSLTITICIPRSELHHSAALLRLWILFYAGTAVLGMTLAACCIPLVDALSRRGQTTLEKWFSTVTSDPYFWLTAVSGVTAVGLLLWTGWELQDTSKAAGRFLAACRSIDLTSGVCPLAPLSLFVLCLVVWCFIQLRRVSYHEDRRPSVPDLPYDVFCPELQHTVADVNKRITASFFHPAYNAVCALVIVVAAWVSFAREQQTLEDRQMDRLMLLLAFAAGISLLTVCMRFALIWSAFREFLQQLERHPLREIFDFLPRGFLWAPMWQGGSKKRTHVAITRSLECVRALIKHPRTPAHLASILKSKMPELTASIREILTSAAARKRVPAPKYQAVQQQLSFVGTAVAAELEWNKWPHGSYEARSELSNRDTNKGALSLTRGEFEFEEPYTISSELLALRFIPFISYVLLQLQNLATYLSAGFILLLTGMNCYVFRARTIIDWFLAALFVVLGVAVVTVFAQLDRDAVFSRITRTEEGKLDRNFFMRLLSYGGIPTLALLASHVPFVARFFFSWIKPAMDAIH